jgi:ferredoxin
MNRNKLILNYYFSGSGNTASLVRHFSQCLETLGFRSVSKKMDRDPMEELEDDYILGLMFPVALQSTFPLVWDFIENLPLGKGRKVFMFDTMEAFSGGVVGPIKKSLVRKGYQCIGAREFIMSSSINTNPKKIKQGQSKNNLALKQVEQYAKDLALGKTKWRRVPLFSNLTRMISKPSILWKMTSKSLSITDNCNKCLLCKKNCPTDAITPQDKKVSIDNSRCISCMRCAAHCPQKAILFMKKELFLSNNKESDKRIK